MIDLICKTVKPSHLEKLQIMQNIKNLMLQVIFIYSDWIFIKQIIVRSLRPFLLLGETDFRKNAAWGEWLISFCLWHDDKNLGASFECGKSWVKMPRINAFSRNVNSINLKVFPTHSGISKFETKFNNHSGGREIKPWGAYRNMKGCIFEANLEGKGW